MLYIDIPGSCGLYDDVIWLDSSRNEADASFVVVFRHGFGYDAAITRGFKNRFIQIWVNLKVLCKNTERGCNHIRDESIWPTEIDTDNGVSQFPG